jgi:hypothetical protein
MTKLLIECYNHTYGGFPIDGDSQPFVVSVTPECLKVSKCDRPDYYGQRTTGGELDFQCPMCRQPRNVKQGDKFPRNKYFEVMLVGGLNPENSSAKFLIATRQTTSQLEDAEGGVRRAMKLLADIELGLRSTTNGVFGAMKDYQADLERSIKERDELEKESAELQKRIVVQKTRHAKLMEQNEGRMAELRRIARKEVENETWAELKRIRKMHEDASTKYDVDMKAKMREMDQLFEGRRKELEAEIEKILGHHQSLIDESNQRYEHELSQNEKRISDLTDEFERHKCRLKLDINILVDEKVEYKEEFDKQLAKLRFELEHHQKLNEAFINKLQKEADSATAEHERRFEEELSSLSVGDVFKRLKKASDREKVLDLLMEKFKTDINREKRRHEEDALSHIDGYIKQVTMSKKAHVEAKHRAMMADIETERAKMLAEIERERREAKYKTTARLKEIDACLPEFMEWFKTNRRT